MGGLSPSSKDIRRHYEEHDYYGGRSYYSSGSDRSESVIPKKRVTNADQIFTASEMLDELNPAKIKLPREALDSAMSPKSRPFVFGEDVTGSMGRFLLELIQNQFPELIEKLLGRYSFNPHLMFMGIGDVEAGDRAPLQVTQFESDLRMLEQLVKIWLEKCGGGNDYESYILAWYFCAKYCKIDSFDKRGEKGFCFTFGDEEPTPSLTARELRKVFGDRNDLDTRTVTATDCLEMAQEKFYCYHIILPGGYYTHYPTRVISKWRELLGGHACVLEDYEYLPDLICAIVDMYEGVSKVEAIQKIASDQSRNAIKKALEAHEEYVQDVKADTDENQEEIEIF